MAKEKLPVTPVGIASYPHLLEVYDESGKFEITQIFGPKADTAELERIIEDAAKLRWPDKKKRPANFRNPLRNAEEKEGDAGYEDAVSFAKFKTNRRPKVRKLEGKEIVEVEIEVDSDGKKFSNDLYAGMKGVVSYSAKAYSKDGGNGVSLYLINYLKVGEGEPIGGISSDPDEDFEGIEAEVDDDLEAAF